MKTALRCAVALTVCLGLAYGARAQTVPAPPPAATGILGLAQAIAGALKACKAKICACPLGQIITNAAKPLNMIAGGLLCPPCCPPINPDDLKKPPTSPQGACAKIMQEEAEMPARRKAIQCLMYADCHWWPEAEAALINGLRADPNECVRLAAAQALAKGCCCTRPVIEALAVVVSGSKKDNNPSENSERVKAVALMALQHCLATYVEEIEPKKPEKPLKPPAPPAPPAADAKPAPAATAEAKPPLGDLDTGLQRIAYYYEDRPAAAVLADARRVYEAAVRQPRKPAPKEVPAGSRNLYQIWMQAKYGPTGRPPATASVANNARMVPVAGSPLAAQPLPQR